MDDDLRQRMQDQRRRYLALIADMEACIAGEVHVGLSWRVGVANMIIGLCEWVVKRLDRELARRH